MMSKLRTELKKRNDFDSLSQEALLSILRTSDLLENRVSRLLRQYELTMAQYNVLRILRGNGKPMPTLEVAESMIQVAPAITRLVENLRSRGLVVKSRHEDDARVFMLSLTNDAKKLLRRIDRPLLTLHDQLMDGVNDSKLRALIDTLDAVRVAVHKLDD
ncbi:MAG: MarR family transcriptional regulator [Aureliella sp.]